MNCPYYPAGLAAEVQPSGRLRGQVLLLPHVPRCGLHGVEAVLRPGSSEQVRQPGAAPARLRIQSLQWVHASVARRRDGVGRLL